MQLTTKTNCIQINSKDKRNLHVEFNIFVQSCMIYHVGSIQYGMISTNFSSVFTGNMYSFKRC